MDLYTFELMWHPDVAVTGIFTNMLVEVAVNVYQEHWEPANKQLLAACAPPEQVVPFTHGLPTVNATAVGHVPLVVAGEQAGCADTFMEVIIPMNSSAAMPVLPLIFCKL